MAFSTTTRLGIRHPDLAQAADLQVILNNLALDVDAKAVGFYTPAVFAARPAAGVGNMLFWATDTGILYFDNGTTWRGIGIQASGATVAALNAFFPGTPPDGAKGLLTLSGGTIHLPVTFSVAVNKWITDRVWETLTGDYTVTGGEADLGANTTIATIEAYKAMYDAGLRPQHLIGGLILSGDGVSQTRLNYNIRVANSGDQFSTATNVVTNLNGGIGTISPSFVFAEIGWVDPTGITAPTKTHGLLVARLAADSGGGSTGRVSGGSIKIRMIG